MFTFQRANAKLKKLEKRTGQKVYSASLIAGYSCPHAQDCLSKAVRDEVTGKTHVEDGLETVFRCFSASQEAQYPNTFNERMNNFNLMRGLSVDDMISEISVPTRAEIIRLHVSGDFFNRAYMEAWLEVARNNPNKIFYGYTKSLPFWVGLKDKIDRTDNFILTASWGGRRDDLIEEHGLRSARVVYSEDVAHQIGLEIDSDDFHAYDPENSDRSFALLIHGMQPKGSEAGKAVRELKGRGSYGSRSVVHA